MGAAAFLAVLLALGGAAAAESRLAGELPGKRLTKHSISLSTELPCGPAEAYRFWSTAEGVKIFLAPEADVGPVGGPYTIVFAPEVDPAGWNHGTAGARVLASEQDRFFAFEWIIYAGDRSRGSGSPPYAPDAVRRPPILPTWVELTFTPTSTGSRLNFAHFGFGDSADELAALAWFDGVWRKVLVRLAETCR